MTRMIAAPLVSLVLLLAPTLASAECAWLMWAYTSVSGTPPSQQLELGGTFESLRN